MLPQFSHCIVTMAVIAVRILHPLEIIFDPNLIPNSFPHLGHFIVSMINKRLYIYLNKVIIQSIINFIILAFLFQSWS